MTVTEVGEALRALRYRRGEFAAGAARLRFIAEVHGVLRPGTVSRLIFTATVVERVPYKMIARELAISLRQFFRLRNQMIEEIRAGLAVQRLHVSETINTDCLALEIARRALDHGHTTTAVQMLKSVMDRSLRAPDLLEALVLQARASCDAGEPAGTQTSLEEAGRIALRFGGEQRMEWQRDIELARAYALYRDGSYDAAMEASQRALPLHEIVPSNDPYAARKLARHALFLAVQHEEGGSLDQALEYLRAAQAVLMSLERPPAAEIAQIYVHRAFVRAGMPSDVTAAPHDAAEAVRIAAWHGLTAELVWANLALAMSTYGSNPQEGASLWASRAMRLGAEHLSGDPLARTLFIGSRFECAAGRPADALAHVLQAEPHVRGNNLLQAIFHLAQARACQANGDHQRSIDAATQAIQMMEGRSHSHYIGLAYLKRGSSRALRKSPQAREDVECAISYLERGAPLNDRMEALTLSASVTRNRVHRREAEELRHLLAAASGQ